MSPCQDERYAPLISRIRGEYTEMPGLRLSIAQATRLWGLDGDTCALLLGCLVEEGFLQRSDSGLFSRLIGVEPRSSMRMARTSLTRARYRATS